MPLYEYQCKDCKLIFEIIFNSFEDRPEKLNCPRCRQTAHVQPSRAAFVLKGPGFHCNDYPKGGGT